MRLLNLIIQDFGEHVVVEIKRADGVPEFKTMKFPMRSDADKKALAVGVRAAVAAFMHTELHASCVMQMQAAFEAVRE